MELAVKKEETLAKRPRGRIERGGYLWLLLPALLFYGLFFLYPTAQSARWGFFDWTGFGNQMNFIGLQNYRKMLSDLQFYRALGHSLVFFLAMAVFQSTVGLFLALQLNARPRFHQVYRVIIFLPVTLSLVNTGFIWNLMLSNDFGIVNPALKSIGLASLAHPWLADPSTALPTVIFVQAWQWIGLPVVVFLAGLTSVNRDLLETAWLEGAGNWDSFRHVVFPQLAPAFTAITMLACIRMFRIFDLVYVLEGPLGSPLGNTKVVSTLIYTAAFGSSGAYSINYNMSYACAIAVLSSLILLGITIGLLVLLRRRERDIV